MDAVGGGPSANPDGPTWGALFIPVGIVGLGWSGFQIVTAIWPYVDILIQRSAHVSFATSLALLLTSREYGPAGRPRLRCSHRA